MNGFAQVLTCALVLSLQSLVSAQPLSIALPLARAGKVDVALAELKSGSKDAGVESLRCSLFASIDQRDAAVRACEAAAELAPESSSAALELARAYGAKAEHSGALTGMRMVSRIRENFERAVKLDGNNVEALSDLGQFYVEAPTMVGGGLDKAESLVARLQSLSPARAHRLAGMIAAKRKDDINAEREFQAEVAAVHGAEAYIDLAKFYRNRKQIDSAAENAKLALEHDPKHGPDTLDAADLLVGMKRYAPAAQAGLHSYLKAPQEKVASYAKAHVLLGQSLVDAGDRTGAKVEFQAALALAHEYEVAQQGLNR